MLRSATVVLLLLSIAALCQPLPDPFVAYQSDSGSLTGPRLTMRDSAVADVFWIHHVISDGEQYTQHAVVSLTSRQLVSGPDVLQHTPDWTQQIGDVISRGQEGWAAMLYELRLHPFGNVPNRLFFASGGDTGSASAFLDSATQSYMGCSGWINSKMRLVDRLGGGWILSWVRNGCREIPGGGFSEPENSIQLGWVSTNSNVETRAACCIPDYLYGPEDVECVSLDHDTVLTLSLHSSNAFGDPAKLSWQPFDVLEPSHAQLQCTTAIADFRRTRGSRLLALTNDGSSPPQVTGLIEIQRDGSCASLHEWSSALSYQSLAYHPDYGLVILSISGPFILLSRIDTSGTEVQPLGVFYTADPGRLIPEASVTIADGGRVVVLWTERDDDVGMTPDAKMAWVDWSTFLEASERPSVPKPSSLSLSSYPNPFNSELRIEYALPKAQNVELSVYNLLGQKVATLYNGMKTAGTHAGTWTPQCGTGIYFVTLKTSESVRTTKVAYLR